MANVKNELVATLSKHGFSIDDIEAIKIWIHRDCGDRGWSSDVLLANNELTEKQLDALDIEYDNGFGTQYIFGTILMKDDSWFTRVEYDGAESWEFHKKPTVDEVLRGRLW